MELYQLRSFTVVAECENLTRAASRLHISQPALSAQIRALEDELEVALFERRPSGMFLTPIGRRLLARADQVIASAQALKDEARTVKGEVAGTVRVGTLSDAAFIRLGAVLSAAVERYPLLEVQLHHEVSGAAFERVRSGALDASFYYGEMSHPAVTSLVLRDMIYRIVAPAAWAARLNAEGANPVVDEPWILAPEISTHHQLARAWFREVGAEPTTIVQADDESVISSLVVSGLGMALMREDAAAARVEAGEVCLWRDVRLRTRLQFIYPRNREHDPVVGALRDVVRAVWQAPGGSQRDAAARRGRQLAAPAAGAERSDARRAVPAAHDPGAASGAGS